MTDYNPAHKTSSITSITSTSTASTWEHPISTSTTTNNYAKSEEYPEFDASLVSERIAIPPFDYFEDTATTTGINDSAFFSNYFTTSTDEIPELLPSATIKKDAFTASHNSSTNRIVVEPIYLQQAHQMTLKNSSASSFTVPARDNSPTKIEQTANENNNNKSLTTEDEKRTNHIISEQKRRNNIRLGFKELTDIVPTLKNINNSKSTILFKAVEFMKHLEKRNRSLKDKVKSLQIKLQVQGRVQKKSEKRQHYAQHLSSLPPDTISALIAHKNQQKQLELLQNQLRIQHQLLQKHNIASPFIIGDNNSQKTYNSILIPSSRSSENDEHPPSSFLTN